MNVHQALSQLHIPTQAQNDLLAISQIRWLDKDEYFIRAGHRPHTFALLIHGLCRYFYIDPKGKEHTKGFIIALNVAVAYSALLQDVPSLFYIQALQQSQLLEIPYDKWQQLHNTQPFWDKFLIFFLQKGYLAKEKRERDFFVA